MVPIPKQPPETRPTAQQTAITYAAQGWPCFPCRHEAEDVYDPQTGELEERGPKTPLISNGVHGAYKRADVVDRAWNRYPNAMIGLPTGSGISCLTRGKENAAIVSAATDWTLSANSSSMLTF